VDFEHCKVSQHNAYASMYTCSNKLIFFDKQEFYRLGGGLHSLSAL